MKIELENSEKEFKKNIAKAIKWSTGGEIVSKLISPVTYIILARLLAPEIFGIVALVTLVTSFADMFTNSGFQKFLIQHEFVSSDERNNNASVAFWTNLGLSMLLWGIIALFSEEISSAVGNPGLGLVIIVASVQLPITSFSSIQIALYRRKFDFKTLFVIRLITALIPLVITVPLAIMGLGYWSLITGTLFGALASAIIMTLKSEWKPNYFFSFSILKKMLYFSLWSTVDAVVLWVTRWVDVFIIGTLITSYYLGLYKVSLNLINSLLGLITSAIAPVLFSGLSRLQKDENAFKVMFLKTQKFTAFLLFPLGIGIFLYSDIATKIILGNKWSEAGSIIGIWGLVSALMIVLSNFNSDVFRAKGRPDISVKLQTIHMVFVVLACYISVHHGFWVLVYTRAFIRFTDPIVSYYMMKRIANIGYRDVVVNIAKPALNALIMGVFAFFLRQYSTSMFESSISIVLCIGLYVLLGCLFARSDFKNIIKMFK